MRPQRGKTPAKTPSRPVRPTTRSTSSNSNEEYDPVEVYCRIRPFDGEKCIKMVNDKTIQVYQTDMQCKFSKVFGETVAQNTIFDAVGNPLVDGLLHGKNGLLFTYGITSSGKTYTMTGHGDDQGILPRCLDMVFNSIEQVQARKYVFITDKQNGFDVQTEADAMLERQRREILPQSNTKTRSERTDYTNRQKDPSKVVDIDEDCNFAVFVSFVEMYNNHIYDLLEELPYDPITGSKPPQNKHLREDNFSKVMYVHNVTEFEVKSTEEAFEILAKGQKRRKVAHTVLNAESSRSHSVFNIRLVQAPLDSTGKDILTDKNRIIVSQLSLVDLAGSERTKRTNNTGDRLKEAGLINQSLLVLRQCIDLLRENQKNGTNKMVPFRDSKITHLFKNYFDGEGSVRMIVCVNPKASEYDETLHVMRFAEATQEVQVHRALEKKPDVNFISGRRKLAAAGIQVVPPPSSVTPGDFPRAPVPFNQIYALPPFPVTEYMNIETNEDLLTMQNYVENVGKIRQRNRSSLQRQQDAFRAALLTFDKEHERLNGRVNTLEELIRERDRLLEENNRRLYHLEKENQALRKRTCHYEKEAIGLENELRNRNFEINQVHREKDSLKTEFENQVAETEAGCLRALEAEKQRIKQEALDNLTVKERKLRLLKNIVNSSDVESLGGDVAEMVTPQRKPRTPGYAASTVSSAVRGVRPTTRSATRKPRAISPPASIRPTPVKVHRRSRSADKWLEHRPEHLVPMDTVMQPKMKKKKSVSKLEVKDTNKASKYLLTTQDMDTAGHVETKLVKGQCMATAGGGSAVIFTDVETLRQTSPGDSKSSPTTSNSSFTIRSKCKRTWRKRRYLEQKPEDYEGEWTDTEERCNVAVEGHGVYKRVRQLERAASQTK